MKKNSLLVVVILMALTFNIGVVWADGVITGTVISYDVYSAGGANYLIQPASGGAPKILSFNGTNTAVMTLLNDVYASQAIVHVYYSGNSPFLITSVNQ